MPINIQNIINQLEAKLTAADSNTSSNESLRLINLIEQINGSGGILEYQFPNQLPPVDSAQIGKLAYVRETDFYYDSSGLLGHFPKYYFAANDSDGWSEFDMNAKLNADSDYQAYIASISSSAGGGAAGPSWVFQGSSTGYVTGGIYPSSNANLIRKFSFASDGNSTAGGNLTRGSSSHAGHSSSVSGYTSDQSAIDKFPFADDGNATDVGDLSVERFQVAGISSTDNGYAAGGRLNPPNAPTNVIDKFPFASDANATDVGDLTQNRGAPAGQSGTEAGYSSGGYLPGGSGLNTIDKFPFATDVNATDVGDLTVATGRAAGQSSDASGYTSGGHPAGANTNRNVIDKFPFASDANATDVGNLTQGRGSVSGQSSTESGYSASGQGMGTPVAYSNVIDKFPFASDCNATDVGDLVQGNVGGITAGTAGHQV